MLKYVAKYEDFNGNEVEDVLYFNITKTELLNLETSGNDGASRRLMAIISAQDTRSIYNEFKEFLLLGYGEKSEDGRRHLKSEEIRYNFEHSAAFDSIMGEMLENPEFAAEFIEGMMPKDVIAAGKEALGDREPTIQTLREIQTESKEENNG